MVMPAGTTKVNLVRGVTGSVPGVIILVGVIDRIGWIIIPVSIRIIPATVIAGVTSKIIPVKIKMAAGSVMIHVVIPGEAITVPVVLSTDRRKVGEEDSGMVVLPQWRYSRQKIPPMRRKSLVSLLPSGHGGRTRDRTRGRAELPMVLIVMSVTHRNGKCCVIYVTRKVTKLLIARR